MSPLRWPRLWLAIWVMGMLIGIYLSLRTSALQVPMVAHLDKLIHASGYGVLALLACGLFPPGRARLHALIGLVVLGALIEVAQGLFTVNRQAEVLDFLANVGGIVLVSILFWRTNILRFLEQCIQTCLGLD
jgi:VanZ family protein